MKLKPPLPLHLEANRSLPSETWRHALRVAALLLSVCILGAFGTSGSLTSYFFIHQDFAVGIATVLFFALLTLLPAANKIADQRIINPQILVAAGSVLLLIGGYFGHYLILHGYNFSRDEQMATQDAAILASGHFAIQVPNVWSTMVDALNRTFGNVVFRPDLTVSGYRPVNAMLHAAMLRFGAITFTAPLLSAIALIATWRVAQRIWPNDRNLHVIAIILYLCSVQVWATSMTTYAMSALLAFNMVWLSLFLRGGKLGYGLAAFVGFAAVGIHQIPYHLLFVAPFLVLATIQKRWKVAIGFGALYLAAIIFWLNYEYLASFLIEGNALKPVVPHVRGILGPVMNPGAFAYTSANILRFFAWQHLLLLPLVIVAALAAARDRHWLMLAMLVACILPPLAKFPLVAYQGHGWGYRYEHGMIGLLCLLGAVGWTELQKELRIGSRHFGIATIATLCLSAPWLLWQASLFSGVYADVDARIAASKADIVILDSVAPFSNDIIINRADLTNRPIRLLAAGVDRRDVGQICRNGTVTLMPASTLNVIDATLGSQSSGTSHFNRLAAELQKECPARVIPF